MGMSASQVRFLSLQNRKHDIGRQLTALSNKKMALSRDMNKVSRNYTNALNQKTLKWSNDSGASYNALSYNLMMKPNSLNSTVPYIVSTRDGKVVVDNNADILTDLLSGANASYENIFDTDDLNVTAPDGTVSNARTYQKIAELISTFTDSSKGIEGGSIQKDVNGNIIGGTANKGAYVIPKNHVGGYDDQNSLRIQCLRQAGVITGEEMDEYNSIIAQLYGSNPAVATRSFDEWLATFDEKGKTATITTSQGDVNYPDVFGGLIKADEGWYLDESAPALGNLVLAKAYQKEYQVYLNTPIRKGITTEIDNTNELIAGGVSERIRTEVAPTNGSLYNSMTNMSMTEETFSKLVELTEGFSTNVNKKNWSHYEQSLGFQTTHPSINSDYNNSYENVNNNSDQWNMGINVWADDVDLKTGDASKSNNPIHMSDLTWATMYDTETGSASMQGMSLNIYYWDEYVNVGTQNPGNLEKRFYSVVDAIITGYAAALTTPYDDNGETKESIIHNDSMMVVQKQALAFAQAKTYEVYTNTPSNNSDSCSTDNNAVKSAGARANENFGLGQNREGSSHNKYYSVNMTNIMNVFNTFYNMYMDSAITYIKQGHELNPNVHSAYGDYDSRILYGTLQETNSKGLSDNDYKFLSERGGLKAVNIDDYKTLIDGNISVQSSDQKKGEITLYDNGDTSKPIQVVQVSGTSALSPGTSQYNNTITYSRSYINPSDGSSQTETVTITYDDFRRVTRIVDSSAGTDTSFTYANGRLDKSVTTFTGNKPTYQVENGSHSIAEISTVTREWKTNYDGVAGHNGYVTTVNYNSGNPPITTEFWEATGQKVIYANTKTASVIPKQGNFPVNRIIIDQDGSMQLQYWNSSTQKYQNLLRDDAQHYLNKGLTRTTEYHYSNADSVFNDPNNLSDIFAYDLFCHGGDEGHADVLKSYQKGTYASDPSLNGIANYIIVFPEDLYGEQIDNMVRVAQERVDNLTASLERCFSHKTKIIDYFDALFQRISESGWQVDNKVASNREYLNNKLQNNEYFVTVCTDKIDETGYNFVNKMANTVMKIFEVTDDNKQNEALSKYEADKTLISSKERKVDMMMKKLETEQEAINTELDAVQKVENENIERTFKMFA